ncbi:RHS repeat domain-containing protein, partial [Pararcticibacter amylolyticus]
TNGTIDFIQTEEGRAVRNTDGTYRYEYDLKDHLGNTRVSTDAAGNVIQEDEYYAFGLNAPLYAAGAKNKYLYNGKEIQDVLTDQYDYGARFYDPVIGRFNTIDPLANEFESISPYNYALNNPILMVDPDGMAADTLAKLPVYVPKPSVSNVAVGTGLVNILNGAGGIQLGEVGITLSRTAAVASEVAGPVAIAATTGWTAGDAIAKNMKSFSAWIAAVLVKVGVDPKYLYAPELRPDIVKSNEDKTADELLPGSLKKSPSYYPPYGNKTRKELTDLGQKGDQRAKKMKKLIDQIPRLLDKNKNK